MNRKSLIIIAIVGIGILVLFFSFAGNNIFTARSSKPVPDSVLFTSAPALTPQQALHTFSLADGFRIELVASEPLIQAPIAMDFDAKGRIWVVEMQSYMPNPKGKGEERQINKIVILEDHNDDGRMDHSKVFLDSLVMPRAISIVNGGILYVEPPNLWFVENVNDKPGKKILVDSTYAVGGNPEHQPNGLLRGIDNWYYSAKSKDRYKYQNGQWIKEDTEFRGQWGITKDNYGRLFYNTNSNQLRGDLVPPNHLNRNSDFDATLGINIEIAEDQRVYPIRPTTGVNRGYREKVLDESGHLVNFTAACGPVIYRGDQFPEAFEGNAFVCEPAANLIKRNILIENGPYIKAKQAYEDHEFLASTDERFRPVNLYNGPDGSLYVVDMYRGIIQHETYLTDYLLEQIESRNLAKPLGLGRIYRIVYEGNWLQGLINGVQRSPDPDLLQATDKELVSYLSHPNGWWRDNAQRLLVQRGHKAIVPEIVDVLKQEDTWGKIHALWSLEGLNAITPKIVELAVQDQEPKVIATALRVGERKSGSETASDILDIYEKVLANKNPVVQLQLALSLGEFMETDSLRVMNMLRTIAINQGDDPLTREAIVSSLQDKEARFLSLLMQKPPFNRPMMAFLRKVIENTRIENHLKSRELTPEEEKQYLLGKSLFEKTCAGCHNVDGEGLTPIAPPLNGSKWVTGPKERLIRIVLHGLKGPVTVRGKVYQEPEVQPMMPGIKDNKAFTDEKLAAVLTYIRNAWNNDADVVDASTVKSIRKRTSDREKAYTEKDFIQ